MSLAGLVISNTAISNWNSLCNTKRNDSLDFAMRKICRAIFLGKMIHNEPIHGEGEVKGYFIIRFYDINIHIKNSLVFLIERDQTTPMVEASKKERALFDMKYGIPSRFNKIDPSERQLGKTRKV